jgi:hypothetical protein
VAIGTGCAAAVVAAATLVAPAAGGHGTPLSTGPCGTIVSAVWTRNAAGVVTHGRRYRVVSERLPCFVVTRLAAELIPLRTARAFAAARPAGYLCLALGTAANPYRPATAVGTCLQKPVASPPPRSFSWRPAG